MIELTGRASRIFITAGAFIAIASCSHLPTLSKADKEPQKPPQQTAEATKAKVQDSYGKLPLYFIKNEGQVDPKVEFYEKGTGHATYFTKDGVYVSLVGASRETPSPTVAQSHPSPIAGEGAGGGTLHDTQSTLVKLIPLDANKNPKIVAEGVQEGKVNYFIGNDSRQWKTNVPTYQAVVYQEIYPGIDIKFYGNNRQLEYDIIVKPGADPSKVTLAYEGITRLRVTEDGDLEIGLKEGTIIQRKPVVYQEIDGKRVDVMGMFKVHDRHNPLNTLAFSFEVASYDKKKPLVIDPVLVYSSYLGGNGSESWTGVGQRVPAGNFYITGTTSASNFPTASAFQSTYGGGATDTFVTQLDLSGALIYSTYLGGGGSDLGSNSGRSIFVDDVGNAFIMGTTSSSNFPTANAFQPTYGGGAADAFITNLDASGAVVYSTYLGGNGDDFAFTLLGGAGNLYVGGSTSSTDFPTANAFQPTYGGGAADIFITKVDSSGAVVYSTYLGGSGTYYNDTLTNLDIDSSGNELVTGYTSSSDFPTANAFQSTFGGICAPCSDVFVTKLGPSGTVIYSTYLGGSGMDFGGGRFDGTGNTYVSGITFSNNFPTVNAIQSVRGGLADAFVTKLDPSGTVVFSTYLGGNGDDGGGSLSIQMAIDSSSNVYLAGTTDSSNFPTSNAFQSTYGGFYDAWVTKLGPSGTMVFSTYLGGSSLDQLRPFSLDSAGNTYAIGTTWSTNFPTVNAFQATHGGGTNDLFITKFAPSGTVVYSTYLGGNGQDQGPAFGSCCDNAGNIYVAGQTSSSNFPTVNPLQGTYGGGTNDLFITQFNASGTVGYSTYLGGDGNDQLLLRGTYNTGNVYVLGLTTSSNFPTANAFQPTYGGGGDLFVAKINFSTNLPQLTNISTRARVLTGDNVMIGGFIIGGTDPKTVLIRARGPSMGGAPFNVPGTLANPFVQLYSFATGTFIAQNDNWQVSDPLCASSGFVCGGLTEISATGLDPCIPNPGQGSAPPGCSQESAIVMALPPGNYGAIVSGVSEGTGVGLVEVFEVGSGTSRLSNISTRAFVDTGDNVEIGGFIIGGTDPKQVLIRARGPSMGGAPFNVPATLANPFVQLYSFATGTFIAQNDNWQVSDPLCAASGFVCGGLTEISATGLDPCLPNPGQISAPPGCAQEAAILITLPPGNYGAIVSGVSEGTGVGLVEVFEVP